MWVKRFCRVKRGQRERARLGGINLDLREWALKRGGEKGVGGNKKVLADSGPSYNTNNSHVFSLSFSPRHERRDTRLYRSVALAE